MVVDISKSQVLARAARHNGAAASLESIFSRVAAQLKYAYAYA
jgi:hypothetical protein